MGEFLGIPQREPKVKASYFPLKELEGGNEWSDWISLQFPDFNGDVKKAGHLMAAFNEGKRYVYDGLVGRGLKSFRMPLTAILDGDMNDNGLGVFGYEPGRNRMDIRKTPLERYSRQGFKQILALPAHDGELAFKGYLPDLFRLQGVEETHHAAFMQNKKDFQPFGRRQPELNMMQ